MTCDKVLKDKRQTLDLYFVILLARSSDGRPLFAETKSRSLLGSIRSLWMLLRLRKLGQNHTFTSIAIYDELYFGKLCILCTSTDNHNTSTSAMCVTGPACVMCTAVTAAIDKCEGSVFQYPHMVGGAIIRYNCRLRSGKQDKALRWLPKPVTLQRRSRSRNIARPTTACASFECTRVLSPCAMDAQSVASSIVFIKLE